MIKILAFFDRKALPDAGVTNFCREKTRGSADENSAHPQTLLQRAPPAVGGSCAGDGQLFSVASNSIFGAEAAYRLECAGLVFLLFLWWFLLKTPTQEIARIAREQDESAATVLALVCLTCLASILTILFELGSVKQLSPAQQVGHIALTASTLVVSWTLLPTTFSLHYAHMYYQQNAKGHRMRLFPDNPSEPGYWDFVYCAFTIAVAAQTVDVATGNTAVRQITTLQVILSFVFNLAILGLSINVAAGLLS